MTVSYQFVYHELCIILKLEMSYRNISLVLIEDLIFLLHAWPCCGTFLQ
jgi:hypothetical protein